MWSVALLLVLAAAPLAPAPDLPPGALVRLGDDRFRAGSWIAQIAISPDGKQFATTRWIGPGAASLTIWDRATGRPIREFPVDHKEFLWGPGGGFAVYARRDREKGKKAVQLFLDDFRIWDFTNPEAGPPGDAPHFGATGEVAVERVASEFTYNSFQLSADGRRVAALWKSKEGRSGIRVFALKASDTAANLTRVGDIALGAEWVSWFRLSADGEAVVTFRFLANSISDEYAATRWDVSTGKPAELLRIPWAPGSILTPDGRSLVVRVVEEKQWGFDLFSLIDGKQRALARWQSALGRTMLGKPADVGGFAFTSDGRKLIVAIDAKAYIIDLATGKELGRLEGHAETPTAVAISPDGECIATADASGLIRLWDAKTFRPLNEAASHRAPVEYAELSPGGKQLLTWARDETARLWDLDTGRELRAFANVPRAPQPVDGNQPTFTPDGTAILYGTRDRLIARDLQTGLEVPLPHDLAKKKAWFAVFAPGGKSVLTWGSGGYSCDVWDWPSGKKRFSQELRGMPCPGFSPDGSVIFHHAASPLRWDARTGKELPPAWKEDDGQFRPLRSLRPNPGRMIQIGQDGTTLWEAGTGELKARFPFALPVETWPADLGISFGPGDRSYARSSFNAIDTVVLYESATSARRRELRGHRGAVKVLGFTPDGTKLLTAGGEHTILVWDVRLKNVPLPDAIKKETNAAKLWKALASGNAEDAYLAMARLAREPKAALKIAKMKLTPAAKGERETDSTRLTDSRAIELLEALETDESRAFLNELAGGDGTAFRTQEAKRALERNKR